MKLSKKYLAIIYLILFGLLLRLIEFILDYIFGDHNGKINSFGLHIIILIVLFLIGFVVIIWIWKEVVSRYDLRKIPYAVYIIFTLVIVFCILEIFVRYKYDHVDLLGYTGVKEMENPMSTWAVNDAFCAFRPKQGVYDNTNSKTVNSFGFISTPPISYKKNNGTLRIVFIGESSTAGTGENIPDSVTWPWKTIKRIQQTLPDKPIEFINAAVGGYCSFESFGRLWSRLRFFEPDIIIVNHAWNDMYYFSMADSIIKWNNGLSEWSVHEKVKMTIYKPVFWDKFIFWSQALSKLRLRFSNQLSGEVAGETTGSALLDSTFNYDGLKIYSQNLMLFKATCELFGIKLFVCKQPTLISENTSEMDKKRCHYEFHGFNHEAHIKAFKAMYSVVDSLFPENNIIDLTSFSGKSELFYDHIHPTSLGTDEYSRIVSDTLIKFIQINSLNQ